MYRKRHNRRKPMSQKAKGLNGEGFAAGQPATEIHIVSLFRNPQTGKGGFYDRENKGKQASHLDIGTFYDACPAAGWGIRRGMVPGAKALSRRIARLLQKTA